MQCVDSKGKQSESWDLIYGNQLKLFDLFVHHLIIRN